MKNLAYALVLVACVLGMSSCTSDVKKPSSGKNVREKRTCNVSDFERIEANAYCDIKFCQSDSTRVEVEGRKRDLDRLSVEVKDGTLCIDYHDKKVGLKNFDVGGFKKVSLKVSSPNLTALDLRAVGSVDVVGLLDTDTLDIRLQGAGNVELDKVVCDVLRLSMQGSGNAEIDRLTAQHSDIRLRGVGNVEVGFERSGTASCRLDGVGNIELKGTLGHLKKEVNGVGHVDTDQLTVGVVP